VDVDLAKIGMKEMELREESEGDSNEEEESGVNRKTWNIPGQPPSGKQAKPQKPTYAQGMDVDDGEEHSGEDATAAIATKEEAPKTQDETDSSKADTVKEEAAPPEKAKYVPPSVRAKQLSAVVMRPGEKQPKLDDTMEFPSLAAAGQLEEELEKTKQKKKTVWKKLPTAQTAPVSTAPPSIPPPIRDERQRSQTPDRKPVTSPASVAPEPVQDTNPSAPQHESSSQPSGPKKAAYVPPHLRKRD